MFAIIMKRRAPGAAYCLKNSHPPEHTRPERARSGTFLPPLPLVIPYRHEAGHRWMTAAGPPSSENREAAHGAKDRSRCSWSGSGMPGRAAYRHRPPYPSTSLAGTRPVAGSYGSSLPAATERAANSTLMDRGVTCDVAAAQPRIKELPIIHTTRRSPLPSPAVPATAPRCRTMAPPPCRTTKPP